MALNAMLPERDGIQAYLLMQIVASPLWPPQFVYLERGSQLRKAGSIFKPASTNQNVLTVFGNNTVGVRCR